MRTRRKILIAVICLLSLGAASGAALTMRTIAMYSGVCDTLGGFPGMLQQTGFLPRGNCNLERDGHCSEEPCKVDGKKGHCVKREVDHKTVCECKPNRTSRP